ncbi:Tn7 transposase TnsA N-terminal domain-containing protein [Stenotrophomonas sp. HMWF003]|uniref:Tn7 transposase TnsA N-terminal domain-containing protein n=1 Tax=Stenotrophomonas sp. HMWF003 TaxID=2056840 RepID=UPI002159FC7C|nr:Tn7 transposase TnsA N-terminal domain-containing protein [Stenotrophomonas sp. HMWF003]
MELDVLKLLERCEQVAYYQEQPAMIPYTFEGRSRRYFPDLLIVTTDGRGLLLEVKPSDRMALSINQAKSAAGLAWANSQGLGWLVVSDRHTFKDIEEHVIPAVGWQVLDNALKLRGALTWRDLISLRSDNGLTGFDVTAYVVQSGATLDSGYRLTARTV